MKEATVWFTATRQEQTAPDALRSIVAGPVGAPEPQGNVIICTVTRPRAASPLRPVTYITTQHCAVFRYPAYPEPGPAPLTPAPGPAALPLRPGRPRSPLRPAAPLTLRPRLYGEHFQWYALTLRMLPIKTHAANLGARGPGLQ